LRRSATVPPFDAAHGCKQRSRGTKRDTSGAAKAKKKAAAEEE
jgi:hypothetical protein